MYLVSTYMYVCMYVCIIYVCMCTYRYMNVHELYMYKLCCVL